MINTSYTLHTATRGSGQALLQINKPGWSAMDTWIGFVSHRERCSEIVLMQER